MINCRDEKTGRVVVPLSVAGKWVAWNATRDVIVACGESLPEVMRAAQQAGELDPTFERVPPANGRLVGVVH